MLMGRNKRPAIFALSPANRKAINICLMGKQNNEKQNMKKIGILEKKTVDIMKNTLNKSRQKQKKDTGLTLNQPKQATDILGKKGS
jgi:hypothetical protein